MSFKNALENIKSLNLHPFDFDPKALGKRKGLICSIEGYDNKKYLSEASPLPFFSSESYEEVLHEFAQIQQKILHKEPIEETALLPSVHFALTSYIPQDLELKPQKINGLLIGDFKQILQDAAQYQKRGFSHVKVKIAKLRDEEIIYLIKNLSLHFSIRLDTNQTFSFDRAQNLFAPFAHLIEYVEEPLQETSRLYDCNFPIALDETLRTHPEIIKIPPHNLKAFILKPTIIGGMDRLMEYIREAKSKGISVIFSASHESSIGILQIMKLAQDLSMQEIPLGLDTFRFLKIGTLKEKLLYNKDHLISPSHMELSIPQYADIY